MKLLLLGRTGQVGWELQRSLLPLGEVIACDRARADLSDPAATAQLVKTVRPDVVVNAAAYTAVDRAEQDSDNAFLINADTPAAIAEAANDIDALLVHYSTDYIFDGAHDGHADEFTTPNPLNVYGRSKLQGEQAIRDNGCDHLILRTSWVYASRGQNFLLTMLKLATQRSEISIVDDQLGAPTWAAMIADVTAMLLAIIGDRRASGRFESGTYHLAPRGSTTWCGFARQLFLVAGELGLADDFVLQQVKAVTTEAYPTQARRPANSRLAVDRIEQEFGLVMPAWEQGVARCMAQLQACRQHTGGGSAA